MLIAPFCYHSSCVSYKIPCNTKMSDPSTSDRVRAVLEKVYGPAPESASEAERLYQKGFDLYLDNKHAEALEVLLQASDLGSGEADCELGIMHREGKGVPPNLAMAVSCFLSGAKRGHSGSQYLLGKCFVEGEGVEVDVKQAVHWLVLAGEQGNRGASYLLAELEDQGLIKVEWADDQPEED